jgi:hypothetical protein
VLLAHYRLPSSLRIDGQFVAVNPKCGVGNALEVDTRRRPNKRGFCVSPDRLAREGNAAQTGETPKIMPQFLVSGTLAERDRPSSRHVHPETRTPRDT